MDPFSGGLPHGGVRPLHQKSTCLTQSALGPYAVQIWSRNVRKSEPTKPSRSTVWVDHFPKGWEGYRESRRCSRDTYPESYITKCEKYTKTMKERSRRFPRRVTRRGGRCSFYQSSRKLQRVGGSLSRGFELNTRRSRRSPRRITL